MTDSNQPDGMDTHSFDLPSPESAAARLREFALKHGDGRVAVHRDDLPPLYVRDLEVLDMLPDHVARLKAERDELDEAYQRMQRRVSRLIEAKMMLRWLHAEAAWKRDEYATEISSAHDTATEYFDRSEKASAEVDRLRAAGQRMADYIETEYALPILADKVRDAISGNDGK